MERIWNAGPPSPAEGATDIETLDWLERMLAVSMRRWRWTWMLKDPELRRALGDLNERLADLRRLRLDPASVPLDGELSRLRGVTLRDLNRVDTVYALHNRLGRLVVQLDRDGSYVAVRAAGNALRRDRNGSKPKHWPPSVPEVLQQVARQHDQDPAVLREAVLFYDREYTERVLHHQARRRTKARTLLMLAPVLLALLVGLGLLLDRTDTVSRPVVLLVGVAGALGATLSGIFKLRDLIRGLGELRSFRAAMVVQPLVGAAFALFVMLVIEAGVAGVDLADGGSKAATYGVFGFIAGFSEPFALGIVQKVAGPDAVNDAPRTAAASGIADPARSSES